MSETEQTKIECSLGAMTLSVASEDAETAAELFEEIWQSRVEEVEGGETAAMRAVIEESKRGPL